MPQSLHQRVAGNVGDIHCIHEVAAVGVYKVHNEQTGRPSPRFMDEVLGQDLQPQCSARFLKSCTIRIESPSLILLAPRFAHLFDGSFKIIEEARGIRFAHVVEVPQTTPTNLLTRAIISQPR